MQQINDAGGIHGMPIEPFVEDVASDPLFAKEKAKYLIEKENVRILIGPYTSACRKAVIPVLKQYNVLLFFTQLFTKAMNKTNGFTTRVLCPISSCNFLFRG
ncbi:transporter substrate-binding protein [Terrilactibacillus sp. S3-3]|nr:transporter substrate-binding protein [Terrilactibacillus sp. S3-3]